MENLRPGFGSPVFRLIENLRFSKADIWASTCCLNRGVEAGCQEFTIVGNVATTDAVSQRCCDVCRHSRCRLAQREKTELREEEADKGSEREVWVMVSKVAWVPILLHRYLEMSRCGGLAVEKPGRNYGLHSGGPDQPPPRAINSVFPPESGHGRHIHGVHV